MMNGQGTGLGPDLTGSWRNGVDYFLENIVDPNVVVGESFQLNHVTRKDGTVVSGMFENETDASVSIRTITESIVVPKSEVASHQVSDQSMMPSGLIEALSES
jgi:putative heme-binding domain-containing protein